MTEPKPIRLRLSRRKGFNLQALSRGMNGLDVVKVTRPGMWGNLFLVHPDQRPGRKWNVGRVGGWSVPTVEDAVACYREMLTLPGETADALRAALPTLRGKNLACWCALPRSGDPDMCHAVVLLDLANRPACEAIP